MSTARLKFGVVLPTYRGLAGAENIRLAARLSEDLGLDSIWVTDHIAVPKDSEDAFGSTFYEAVSVMSYVSGITARVQIGAAILIVPYRHPILLAKMLATIDQLSEGRLLVGVGLGWLEKESELLGVRHHRRARIADESLQVMRACWEGPMPEFQGEIFSVSAMLFDPRPYGGRRLPVLVGGVSSAALRRVARFGDGWIADGQTFEEMVPMLAELNCELAAVGRGRDEVEVLLRTGLQVVGRAEDATGSPSEIGWKTASLVQATGRTPFRGTYAEVVDDVRQAASLGIDHLVFEFPVSRGEESLDLFETLARVREDAGV